MKISYIKNNIWLSTLVVFSLFFLVYGSIYFFVDGIFATDDHFFHIKLAYLLRTEGFDAIKDFDCMPMGIYARYPLSLFSIFLIPFTFFGDLFVGLQVSDIFLAALPMAIIYFFLRKVKLKYPLLILLILFSSTFLFERLFMGRSYALTFGLILMEIYFVQKKKYIKFFLVSLLHILWHQNSFYLIMIVASSVEAARYLTHKKIEIKSFFFAVGSILLGMAFFPDFPKSIFFWINGAVKTSISTAAGLKLEGSELYPKDIFGILNDNQIISFLAITSIVFIFYFYLKNRNKGKEISDIEKESLIEIYSFFIMLVAFMLGAIKINGRFFDYYLIFAIILLAIILKFLFFKKDIIINRKIIRYLIISCFVFFSYVSVNNYLNLRIKVAKSDYKNIKNPVEWIRDNSDKKDLVYLYNWSDFTIAFFYNDKNIYSWGIEPKNLQAKSDSLYWKAYNIQAYGIYCEEQRDCEKEFLTIRERDKNLNEEELNIYQRENYRKIIHSIKNDFGSRFILSSSSIFSDYIRLNEDLIEDEFESVSKKNPNYKVTAFKLK